MLKIDNKKPGLKLPGLYFTENQFILFLFAKRLKIHHPGM
jgi:hypothetical protein